MEMPESILFYAIFLSQVLLISYYFPKKMLNRVKYVLETYPPSEYPKLYPEPIEFYEKARRNYRNLNIGILLAGLLLLAVLMGEVGSWDIGNMVFVFFMVQFVPVMLIEIRSFKYYKLMRKTDARTTRKADLSPRRLFDFISPAMIGVSICVYFAFIALTLYIRQFDLPWFGGYWNIVGVTASNLFLAGIVAWNMYGKKQDPYQASEDRRRQIELVAQQMVFVSIAATVFIAIEVILASLQLRDLQPMVQSLYFQLLAVICLRTLRIDNINFAVYKADPVAGVNIAESEIVNGEEGSYRYASVGLYVGIGIGILSGAFILVAGGTVKGFIMGAAIGMVVGAILGGLLKWRSLRAPAA